MREVCLGQIAADTLGFRVLCGATARWESHISLSIWELLAQHLNDVRKIVRDESKGEIYWADFICHSGFNTNRTLQH